MTVIRIVLQSLLVLGYGLALVVSRLSLLAAVLVAVLTGAWLIREPLVQWSLAAVPPWLDLPPVKATAVVLAPHGIVLRDVTVGMGASAPRARTVGVTVHWGTLLNDPISALQSIVLDRPQLQLAIGNDGTVVVSGLEAWADFGSGEASRQTSIPSPLATIPPITIRDGALRLEGPLLAGQVDEITVHLVPLAGGVGLDVTGAIQLSAQGLGTVAGQIQLGGQVAATGDGYVGMGLDLAQLAALGARASGRLDGGVTVTGFRPTDGVMALAKTMVSPPPAWAAIGPIQIDGAQLRWSSDAISVTAGTVVTQLGTIAGAVTLTDPLGLQPEARWQTQAHLSLSETSAVADGLGWSLPVSLVGQVAVDGTGGATLTTLAGVPMVLAAGGQLAARLDGAIGGNPLRIDAPDLGVQWGQGTLLVDPLAPIKVAGTLPTELYALLTMPPLLPPSRAVTAQIAQGDGPLLVWRQGRDGTDILTMQAEISARAAPWRLAASVAGSDLLSAAPFFALTDGRWTGARLLDATFSTPVTVTALTLDLTGTTADASAAVMMAPSVPLGETALVMERLTAPVTIIADLHQGTAVVQLARCIELALRPVEIGAQTLTADPAQLCPATNGSPLLTVQPDQTALAAHLGSILATVRGPAIGEIDLIAEGGPLTSADLAAGLSWRGSGVGLALADMGVLWRADRLMVDLSDGYEALTAQTDQADIFDTRIETRFVPLDSTLRIKGPLTDLAVQSDVAWAGNPVANLSGQWDALAGAGTLQGRFGPMDLAGPPAVTTLMPVLLGTVAATEGEVGATAQIILDQWQPQISGAVALSGVGFAVPGASVGGIDSTITMFDWFTLATPPSQSALIDVIDPGLPLLGGEVLFQGLPGGKIRIEDAFWPFFGGILALAPGDIDPLADRIELTAELASVDLGQLLADMEIDGLAGSGRVGGRLPVVLTDGDVQVSGRLASEGEGTLQYLTPLNDETITGWSAQAYAALEDLRFQGLSATVDGSLADALRLGLAFEGSNPAVLEGHPFRFRIAVDGVTLPLLGLAQPAFDLGTLGVDTDQPGG